MEPILGTLGREMLHQQVDLAVYDARQQRHVGIALHHVAVPFGNFIFQNEVVPEHVGRQQVHLPVILVGVEATQLAGIFVTLLVTSLVCCLCGMAAGASFQPPTRSAAHA